MPDKYPNFAALEKKERRGVHFRVQSRVVRSRIAVIAPHGGSIEPGTSEIAMAIAGRDFSFYAFEGTKVRHNGCLHITSTRFDEPTCLALVTAAEGVVAIHGENSDARVVFLGGLDKAGMNRVRNALVRRGFYVKTHGNPRLQGIDRLNICNRGKAQAGVQVELSKGLRRLFFRSLSAKGRKQPKRRLWEFVSGVREALG